MMWGEKDRRMAELEEQNRQWQLYYQTQMLPPKLPPPPKAGKKKAGKKNKVNPNPLSNEVKMWIVIAFASFFAIIIVKNWWTDATTKQPERVERKK